MSKFNLSLIYCPLKKTCYNLYISQVPQDPSTLRKNINYCHSCGNYLPSTDFFITSNSKHVGRCRRCVKIENDGRQREDHTFYRVMLKSLRKSEEAMQDGSSICFLLQVTDMKIIALIPWESSKVSLS